MKVIDISQMISPDMSVYPGTETPRFDIAITIEEAGFLEKRISFWSHTGTHIDAPAHIISGGKTLDRFPVDAFYGEAVRWDCRSCGGLIHLSHLKDIEDRVKEADFVLIETGHDRFWGTEAYLTGYPVLSPDAAGRLGEMGLKGLGIDAISIDAPDTTDFQIHRKLLEQGLVIVENLTNLGALPMDGFTFSCLPLKMAEAEGSPVRAVAVLP